MIQEATRRERRRNGRVIVFYWHRIGKRGKVEESQSIGGERWPRGSGGIERER